MPEGYTIKDTEALAILTKLQGMTGTSKAAIMASVLRAEYDAVMAGKAPLYPRPDPTPRRTR